MTKPLISAEAITKSYFKGEHKVPVLQGAGLKAHRGEAASVLQHASQLGQSSNRPRRTWVLPGRTCSIEGITSTVSS